MTVVSLGRGHGALGRPAVRDELRAEIQGLQAEVQDAKADIIEVLSPGLPLLHVLGVAPGRP